MAQNKGRRRRRRTNPRRIVVTVVAVLAVIGIFYGIIHAIASRKAGTITPSEGVKQPENIEQIQEDFAANYESMPDFEYYEVDGVRYETGSTLRDFNTSGWQIVGDLGDPDWIYSDTATMEARADADLMLLNGEELITVTAINPSSTAVKNYLDCVVIEVKVFEIDGQSVDSITLNGTPIWHLKIDDANKTFDNQSEDSGECLYYYKVTDDKKKVEDMNAVGWSISAGSETNNGSMDWIAFGMDYTF